MKSQQAGMRLLIYSQDGKGLGHLRRTVNISQEVLSAEPTASILVLSDSPSAPFFPPFKGMDYVKLPTIIKTGRDSWRSPDWRTSTLPLGIRRIVELRGQIILQAFCQFKPDVVLVDHMPVGALGELKPMLDRAAQKGRRPAQNGKRTSFFVGLRDVLDAPDVIRRAWTELSAYEYLERYDGVLVYGCQDIYDAERIYALTGEKRKVFFCNYVGPVGANGASVPAAQFPGEALILMMGGGGADAFPLAKAFLQALPIMRHRMPVRGMVLTGPNMARADRDGLVGQSRRCPVLVQSTSENVPALLRNVSAVVTMAGYNSLCEVLEAKTKALVVPRRGPSAEQRLRCELFAQRDLIRVLDPDALTPERLAGELLKLLQEDAVPDPRQIPPLDGARQAARVLIGAAKGHDEGIVPSIRLVGSKAAGASR
jgi:predicted glycosyltransferase